MKKTQTADPSPAALYNVPQSNTEQTMAAGYAPQLRFDGQEPFLPLGAGYTIFRTDAESPSFPRQIKLAPPGERPAALAIEYAIWWDWDIQHLYELEHVWVFVDEDGQVVRAEASWHGDYHDMAVDGQPIIQNGHVVVYSEPGKHAFAPTPAWFQERWQGRRRLPSDQLAGSGGVWVTPLFESDLRRHRTPHNNTLVRTYLGRHAFRPSWDFSRHLVLDRKGLVPWPDMRHWIPERVAWWVEKLDQETLPSTYRFLRIGHRGASAHAPDNTLTSIRRAAELGADAVEIDLQVTGDGQVVVVHDPFLTDRQGHILPVASSALSRLQAVDLGQGERVPLFTDALSLCLELDLGIYVELKDARAIPALFAAFREHDLAHRTVIGAFRPDWLAEVKTRIPNASTSILFSSIHVDPVQLARSIGAEYVHPCWERYAHPSSLLSPYWVQRVREAQLGILCWHEERPEEIAGLRQVGVDGICSDAPELLG
jgi:glycerophosphoryl diester phosphodiesterase